MVKTTIIFNVNFTLNTRARGALTALFSPRPGAVNSYPSCIHFRHFISFLSLSVVFGFSSVLNHSDATCRHPRCQKNNTSIEHSAPMVRSPPSVLTMPKHFVAYHLSTTTAKQWTIKCPARNLQSIRYQFHLPCNINHWTLQWTLQSMNI